jgi:hypothetical protein
MVRSLNLLNLLFLHERVYFRKCTKCFDFDLCTYCYMADKHDGNHQFMRFETSNSQGFVFSFILFIFIFTTISIKEYWCLKELVH